MKEKKQNEELQSRREFFKESAKKALPIIGAIALANSPIFAQPVTGIPMGCMDNTCSGGCKGTCDSTCKGGCTGCDGTCKGGCDGSCKGNCDRVSN
ncbi:MAG: Cys-Xaa-Xaa-Xaa repeat radical SAM target protein [Bacteroidales bacterium]|nr:Cys-Xaa-Xaa-Xaa repeat radical SAM target protein [Bacteroidales bacterium]